MRNLLHRLYWRVDAYLMGEPRSAGAEVALRQHLAACAECRAWYEGGLQLMRAARRSASLPAAGELERLARRTGQFEVAPQAELRAPILALVATALALLVVIVLLPRRTAVGVLEATGQRAMIGERLAEAGSEVREGELVTAVEGVAVVRLEGGRDVTLAEGTVMSANDNGAVVFLESGHARFGVEPGRGSFAVQAGATRIEVKGTVFTVARPSTSEVTVAVERGRVEVAGTKGVVTLAAGQRTSVGREGTPEPPSALRPGDSDELRKLGDELERDLKRLGDKVRRLFR